VSPASTRGEDRPSSTAYSCFRGVVVLCLVVLATIGRVIPWSRIFDSFHLLPSVRPVLTAVLVRRSLDPKGESDSVSLPVQPFGTGGRRSGGTAAVLPRRI